MKLKIVIRILLVGLMVFWTANYVMVSLSSTLWDEFFFVLGIFMIIICHWQISVRIFKPLKQLSNVVDSTVKQNKIGLELQHLDTLSMVTSTFNFFSDYTNEAIRLVEHIKTRTSEE